MACKSCGGGIMSRMAGAQAPGKKVKLNVGSPEYKALVDAIAAKRAAKLQELKLRARVRRTR